MLFQDVKKKIKRPPGKMIRIILPGGAACFQL
jgi:hypothetical protein